MNFTLGELAAASDGELIGDPAEVITGAAAVAEATKGEITFFNNPKYLAALRKSAATAAFVPADFAEQINAAQIRVTDPANAFEQVVIQLAPQSVRYASGIHATAIIADDAQLAADVSIQPYAVIEPGARIGSGTVIGAHSYIGHDVGIGADCVIYPNVTIRERTRVGDRVIIHSSAVIGADGFGFELIEGRQRKVPQVGIVQIDNDVEIGAGTMIDRARFGRTWIQDGVKIDNLVQVAHNVVIGKHSVVAAQTGIAGSVRIGQRVMIGGQVGIIGHIEIGDDTMVGAQTGISKNISGGTWWATPCVPLDDAKQHLAWVRRLGRLFERVKQLENRTGS
jgi:UDP-3-O-[3-hydroxymyristoyl] glucosamine N-acyltransferase